MIGAHYLSIRWSHIRWSHIRRVSRVGVSVVGRVVAEVGTGAVTVGDVGAVAQPQNASLVLLLLCLRGVLGGLVGSVSYASQSEQDNLEERGKEKGNTG